MSLMEKRISPFCSSGEEMFDNYFQSALDNYKQDRNISSATHLQALLSLYLTPVSVMDLVAGGGNAVKFYIFPKRVTVAPLPCIPSEVVLSFSIDKPLGCDGLPHATIHFGYRNLTNTKVGTKPISIFYLSNSQIPQQMTCIEAREPMAVSDFTGLIISNMMFDLSTNILYYIRPKGGELIKFEIAPLTNLDFQNRQIGVSDTEIETSFVLEPNSALVTGDNVDYWWSPFRMLEMQYKIQSVYFTDEDFMRGIKQGTTMMGTSPNTQIHKLVNYTRAVTGIDPSSEMLNFTNSVLDKFENQVDVVVSNIIIECSPDEKRVSIKLKGINKIIKIVQQCSSSNYIVQILPNTAFTHL